MAQDLSKLSSSQAELIYKAPLLVCILIAGADGKIDKKEVTEAITMAEKNHWVKSVLAPYFSELSQDFEDKLKMLIQSYPYEVSERTKVISAELAGLNNLWHLIDPEFSVAYYEMLKYLGHRIASSSGGFWGKIAPEEANLVHLPMLLDPAKK